MYYATGQVTTHYCYPLCYAYWVHYYALLICTMLMGRLLHIISMNCATGQVTTHYWYVLCYWVGYYSLLIYYATGQVTTHYCYPLCYACWVGYYSLLICTMLLDRLPRIIVLRLLGSRVVHVNNAQFIDMYYATGQITLQYYYVLCYMVGYYALLLSTVLRLLGRLLSIIDMYYAQTDCLYSLWYYATGSQTIEVIQTTNLRKFFKTTIFVYYPEIINYQKYIFLNGTE